MAQFAADTESLSGLAGDIRLSVTSEQFDLGGYNEQRAHDLIKGAFSKPLTAPTEMVKFQFVVGGGKLVRSRYSDDLPKWLIAALREVGFTEDRSAAETFDSQGTYKQQHDTGQNLKYLYVYPFVTCANKGKGTGSGGSEPVIASPLADESSPQYVVAVSEIATFQEILQVKITSYNQRKRTQKCLQDIMDEFKRIEAKLVAATPLTAGEQFHYDHYPENIEQKLTILQNLIKEMIDQGQLTEKEKAELLKHMEGNLTSTQEEIDAAKTENKPKKVEKLEAKLATITTRKAHVQAIKPISLRLINANDLHKLYHKVFPLLSLEEKSRSMSLTLQDLKLLEEKSTIEDEIKAAQELAKGWFEESDEFEARCRFEEQQAKASYKVKKVASSSGGKSSGGSKTVGMSRGNASSSTSTGWSTVAKKPAGSGASKTGTAAKKPSNGFAAAFDSDSD